MDNFRIEHYIYDGNKITKVSELDKKDAQRWKTELEARALSEYYGRKIIISKI